jgi:hypothetical protein
LISKKIYDIISVMRRDTAEWRKSIIQGFFLKKLKSNCRMSAAV